MPARSLAFYYLSLRGHSGASQVRKGNKAIGYKTITRLMSYRPNCITHINLINNLFTANK
jgi:hypothetical protein